MGSGDGPANARGVAIRPAPSPARTCRRLGPADRIVINGLRTSLSSLVDAGDIETPAPFTTRYHVMQGTCYSMVAEVQTDRQAHREPLCGAGFVQQCFDDVRETACNRRVALCAPMNPFWSQIARELSPY